MALHDEPPAGGGDHFGHPAPAALGGRRLPESISELRAGQRTLSAMLMRLFDELDHRRLQLVEQSRGLAAKRSTSGPRNGGSRAADEQIVALERALAAAQTHHAQRLAEFAVTRIELAAARIELKQVAGPRAANAAGAFEPEPDSLSAELEILRSSAVELARELSESRRQARSEPGEQNGCRGQRNDERGEHYEEHGWENGDLQRIPRLLDDTRDASGEAARSGAAADHPSGAAADHRSGAGGDQLPELLE
jgi:hypothetical protein